VEEVSAMETLELLAIIRRSVLEFRGDGKAGGGLVLAFQSLANLCLSDPEMHVQEWPFFSSARRGANIRSFLRISRRPINVACEVSRPVVSVLMNEGTARSVDFAQGVLRGGTFVINTRHAPEECAHHYRLSGRVITIPGDDIGEKYLKHSIGNVSVYIAAACAIGDFEMANIVESFLETLKKRHIPSSVIDRNRNALLASADAVCESICDEGVATDHELATWGGYGVLPVGAQTSLRLSQTNRTADYAPSGLRLQFQDPKSLCNGCAHCITNCPEGIIQFVPDAELGVKVTGVDVSTFCKLCGECIAVCPEKLFKDLPFEERWEEVATV